MTVRRLVIGCLVAAATACASDMPVPTGGSLASSLRISLPLDSLYVGDTAQIAVLALGPSGQVLSSPPVTWRSTDTSVARIDGSGVVRILGTGSAWVVGALDGWLDSIRLKGLAHIASLTIVPKNITVPEGFALPIVLRVLDANNHALSGRAIIWSSTAPAVVLAGNGGASAVAPGSASVVVSAEGQADTAFVIVQQWPTRVQVTPAAPVLNIGDSLTMTVAVLDTRGAIMPGVPVRFGSSTGAVGRIDSTGTMRTWGVGSLAYTASLANGVTTSGTATVNGVTFSSFAAGAGFGCGIISGSRVACWSTQFGVPFFANPNITTSFTDAMVVAQLPEAMRYVGRSWFHTCAVSVTNAAYCWGSNGSGQIGAPPNSCGSCASGPILVPGAIAFNTVTTGEDQSCGISLTAELWCWGANSLGQLGVGSTSPLAGPQKVSGAGGSFLDVSLGNQFGCALAADSTAWCWGGNDEGQLGNGGNANSAVPVAVAGGLHFARLSAGATHACALTAAGAAWCWGDNRLGELGAGMLAVGTCNNTQVLPNCSSAPIAVTGGLAFTDIAMGSQDGCGMIANGAVYCWGSNFSATGNRLAPGPSTSPGWSRLSASTAIGYVCVMGSDGRVYCWSANGIDTPIRVLHQQ